MKKAIFVLFLLLLSAGAAFYFGWVQFSVPAGQYGVMISKTGGVNATPIEPGVFRWQWEFLLPTNARVLSFNLLPITHSQSVSGMLPSGTVYARMIEGSPDFSWEFTCETVARVTPASLPALVEYHAVQDQQSLELWTNKALSDRVQNTADTVIRRMLTDLSENGAMHADSDALSREIAAAFRETGTDLEIVSVSVRSTRFPDISLYHTAAQTFEAYQDQRRTLWTQTATSEAADSVSDYLSFERFSRWGELLTKYPILIEFFTSAGAENHPLSSNR